MQVNIPSTQRKLIGNSIRASPSNSPAIRYIFNAAQLEVFNMMKLDSFVLFQSSKEVSVFVYMLMNEANKY